MRLNGNYRKNGIKSREKSRIIALTSQHPDCSFVIFFSFFFLSPSLPLSFLPSPLSIIRFTSIAVGYNRHNWFYWNEHSRSAYKIILGSNRISSVIIAFFLSKKHFCSYIFWFLLLFARVHDNETIIFFLSLLRFLFDWPLQNI